MSPRARGCLEAAGLVTFAVALGAFVASTVLRHSDPGAADDAAAPRAMPPEARARIRIEVRNGSEIPGAAGRMTERLRAEGFDVVDFGNAETTDAERTVVIDRLGDPPAAREVAAALVGVPIRTEPDSALYLDVTVLVGADALEVLERRAPAEEPDRGWLDRLSRLWR